ncbi:putative amino acid transporter [Trypanosoma conorhini]|uniref:Putative amino acid transporter n=1 Tax=Trypanosoma conorhini TaxID=83891 RepID=A0A3R7LJI8_9TRYP|nr:putative amino acid transporter [Trypanosoma conorhini]RNF25874.1 putative amino acid transporter [Trypanosoma conorhini]
MEGRFVAHGEEMREEAGTPLGNEPHPHLVSGCPYETVKVGTAALSEEDDSQTGMKCGGAYRAMGRLNSIVPYGGLVSNSFNLASATLGAGIVAIPSGFRDSGIVVAAILLALCCACTVYSIRLLALIKEKTGFRSYEEMARGLFARGFDYFVAFLMFIFCFGTCVGYVISVGDLLFPLLASPSTPEFLRTSTGKSLLVSGVWLLGMFSLSLPKEINSLRHASVVGVSFLIFFVACMVIHAASNGLKGGLSSELHLYNGGKNALNGLSLFIFAFICQVNCFEVYGEMRNPSPNRMTRDTALSMTFVGLLYFFAGFFGYADFGNAVAGSVLQLYDPGHDLLMAVAYVGIAIKLCVGFAICIQPSRDAVYYVLRWGKTSDVPTWRNLLLSGFLALAALILGLFIPSITVVFGFLGGVCGGFLGFLFPAFFYMYAGNWSLREVGWANFLATYCLILLGVVAVVFGTALTIYGEVHG